MASDASPKLTSSSDFAHKALQSWRIEDLARGKRNLDLIRARIGNEAFENLVNALHRIFRLCADPDMGLNNLERFVASEEGRDIVLSMLESRGKQLETLVRILSCSQFLSDLLSNNPSFTEMLRIPLRHSPSKSDLQSQLLAEVESATEDTQVLRIFRRFRQKQLLRIAANDIIRDRPLEEVTMDISRVADAALEVALQVACRNVSRRFGSPMTIAGSPARCVILAFGKHGGQELNYSSDIDLMIVYDDEGATQGLKHISISNTEFYARVTSEIVRLLSAHTDYGQAYRIDLRLRPEGDRGPLARSVASTLAYYDTLGRTWERQALIKLRPVAGDLALGTEFLRLIEPFIYRKFLSLAEINEIKALKRRIEHKVRQAGASDRDVKTGHGGIRDVEFTIQFLQLLNGGDLNAVRQRNTLKAMEALEEVGCLTDQEYQILDGTYRFLRKIEHRLQLLFDLQTHLLPDKEADLRRIARSLSSNGEMDAASSAPLQSFIEDYREKTTLNRKILDHLLHDAFGPDDRQAAPETDLILDPAPDEEFIRETLGRYSFKDVNRAYECLLELSRETVPFLSARRCRHFLASIAPNLLKAIAETPDPDMAMINLEKVSNSLGGKAVLWELFSFSPPTLRLYVDLCAWSDFLSEILINNPGMIDELLDSLVLNQPRTASELAQELRELCYRADDTDLILHSFRDKELLRIGVRDILGKDTLVETTAALSDLAETILVQITDLQLPQIARKFGVPYLASGPRQGEQARFALVALGKLGGREMSYHSDLDLIMIYEGDGRTGPPPGASRFDTYEVTDLLHYFTELAQRVIKAASHMGPRGRLYQVDFRLRPTGKSGSLVTPLKEFVRYFASGEGQLWERQALTRARVVYGDEEFGREVAAALENVVYGPDWEPSIADEIMHMRERVQASGSTRDLKRGFGGIIDIEFLVQLYRLKYGKRYLSVRATNTWECIKAIADAGLISTEQYNRLWNSHEFLRLIESRLRIVHNRSMDELPESPEDVEKLARRLEFMSDEHATAGQRFLDALDWTVNDTRELFKELIEKEKSTPA